MMFENPWIRRALYLGMALLGVIAITNLIAMTAVNLRNATGACTSAHEARP